MLIPLLVFIFLNPLHIYLVVYSCNNSVIYLLLWWFYLVVSNHITIRVLLLCFFSNTQTFRQMNTHGRSPYFIMAVKHVNPKQELPHTLEVFCCVLLNIFYFSHFPIIMRLNIHIQTNWNIITYLICYLGLWT